MLKVEIAKVEPFFIESEDGQLAGLLMDLMEYLADVLNTNFVTIPYPDDSVLGERLENGTWTSNLGRLMKGEFDIILGPTFLAASHVGYFDYSPVIVTENIFMVLNWPRGIHYHFDFIYLFRAEVWIFTLISYLISSVTAALCDIFVENHFLRNAWNKIQNTLLSFFSFFLGIGIPNISSRFHTRLITVMWLIVSFILATSFTGNLVSSLTAITRPYLINSFEQLIKFQGTILSSFSLPPYPIIMKAEATSKFGLVRKKILQDKSLVPIWTLLSSQTFEDVSRGKSVVLLPELMLYAHCRDMLAADIPCSFRIGEETFGSVDLHILIRMDLNETLRSHIKIGVLRYIEAGLRDHSMAKHLGNFKRCFQSPYYLGDDTGPLHFYDITGTLIIYSFGCCVAIFALAAEILVYKRNHRKQILCEL